MKTPAGNITRRSEAMCKRLKNHKKLTEFQLGSERSPWSEN